VREDHVAGAWGRVDDEVDASEGGGRLVEYALHVEVVADVGPYRQRRAALRDDVVDDSVGATLVAQVDQHDSEAPTGQGLDELAAGLGRAAGDDGNGAGGGQVAARRGHGSRLTRVGQRSRPGGPRCDPGGQTRDADRRFTRAREATLSHAWPSGETSGTRRRHQRLVELVGRDSERARLASLVAAARGGVSGVLVVTGPPGIGKTTLLRAALGDPPGFATLGIEGVEAEADLSYSALHRILAPLLPPQQPLPDPQEQALDTVFGARGGEAPAPFLVALATLTLLTDVARRQPLVGIVDDVHWIDQASLLVLAFVARRLLADPIVLVFGARPETEALAILAGLPDLALGGLDRDAQIALLERHAPGLRPEVAERIARESLGNPLALVEHVRGLSSKELSGEAPLVDTDPLPAGIDRLFDRDIRGLPEGARLLLTTAALEPSGDATLIRRSAAAVGVDFGEDPERHLGRLARIDPHVRFAHPLVRSAAYRIASAGERRRIHAALADAAQDGDPVRRAWHLGRAAAGPDDARAEELDRAAVAARMRGGYGAESELLHRSAELTTDAQRREERLLRSATAAVLAGRLARALSLVPASSRNGDRVGAARIALVRAKAMLGVADFRKASRQFADAARTLQAVDEPAARDAWHHALYAAFFADGPSDPHLFDTIAQEAADAGFSVGASRTFVDLLALGLIELRIGDRASGVALVGEAFDTVRIDVPHAAAGIEASFAASAAMEIFDPARCRRARQQLRERDQRAGALPSLRVIALADAIDAAMTGHLREARQHMGRAAEFSRAYGGPPDWEAPILHPLAYSGRDAELEAGYQRLVGPARRAEFGAALMAAHSARGEMLVARGRYAEAVAELRNPFRADTLDFGTRLLPAMVEAAARSGDEQLAREALQRLAQRATAAATPWGLGLLARSRALVASAEDAEALHLEALTSLTAAEMPLDLARARLVYGEWLRRERRRTDAIEQLGSAHEAFAAMGAEAYSERAQSELRAAGGRPRRRSAEARDELTPQERQVTTAAASGATNREIATTMFISEATVAYHLRKVFRKLGVSSRRELRDIDLS
jgi:DNA-binding CsgD family transcriptional regulator